LQRLAGLLRGHGYAVNAECLHLTVAEGDRTVEVWAEYRACDGGRLWFTRAGGAPICEAAHLMDAVVAIKAALAKADGPSWTGAH
jgi:hypothetical protein